jgi:hypothetical protein
MLQNLGGQFLYAMWHNLNCQCLNAMRHNMGGQCLNATLDQSNLCLTNQLGFDPNDHHIKPPIKPVIIHCCSSTLKKTINKTN